MTGSIPRMEPSPGWCLWQYKALWPLDQWWVYSHITAFPAVPGAACSGHAAALLDGAMYVAGGGNNSAGCADLVGLDLGGLGRGGQLAWRQLAAMPQRSPIASEGLSLSPAERAGALVAFGGYNGKYHNGVQVYRPGAPRRPACLPLHPQNALKRQKPTPPRPQQHPSVPNPALTDCPCGSCSQSRHCNNNLVGLVSMHKGVQLFLRGCIMGFSGCPSLLCNPCINIS